MSIICMYLIFLINKKKRKKKKKKRQRFTVSKDLSGCG